MKNKFIILCALFAVFCCSNVALAGDEIMYHEVTGFSLGVASDEAFLVTPEDKKAIQDIVWWWQSDESLILVFVGHADATEWNKLALGDALNSGIAFGRCALGFKLAQDLGACDETRIQCFIREEPSLIGPEYRGFEVKLRKSSWTTSAEFYEFRERSLEVTGQILQTLVNHEIRITALEDFSSQSSFEARIGVGFSTTPFVSVPTAYGAFGVGPLLFEGEFGHSLNSHFENVEDRDFVCHTMFVACRSSVYLFTLAGLDTRLSAGWHWVENYPAYHLGYYEKYDGPELGLSASGDFLLGSNLSVNVFWDLAEEVNSYPHLESGWRNNFHFSVNLFKRFGGEN